MVGLPLVFLDRSLGRIQVPKLLRAGGLELITLAEHYGIPQAEDVEDTTWITDAAKNGWVLFMKDERIRRRPAERAAVYSSQARCFYLANGNLAAAEMARRYLDSLTVIERACEQPGPFLYAVQAKRTELLTLSARDSSSFEQHIQPHQPKASWFE